MRTSVPLSLALTALMSLPLMSAGKVHAQPAQRPEVAAAAKALEQKVIAWRRDFHQHPELSLHEARTAAKVAEHLRALGLKPVRMGGHGVMAVITGDKPGPVIALRADMDALPVTEKTGLPFASKVTTTYNGQTVGVMHACGHDAHTSILMGVAEALVGMRKTLAGRVLLIFQPAEEGEGGAEAMLKEGLFRDLKPEAVFGLHVFATVPAGQIAVRSGPLMAASDRFSIRVTGRQTHGSAPWGGIDPIVAAADLVGSAQTIVSRRTNIAKLPAVVTFGAIKGGVRYNIIPDDVDLVGTIRTFDPAMREAIFADLRNVSEHVAAAHGAKVHAEVPADAGYPVTVNDPALTARMLPSLQAVAGKANVYEPPLEMGAEDFSMYTAHAPGLFFFVGSTGAGIDPATAPRNHSPQFLLDESALDLGFRALMQLALDYLQPPSP